MRMSPSASVSGGNISRKLRIVRGAVPMNEGMLLLACAIEFPRASVMTQAKSFDSRTMVENEVRTSDAAASSTIEMRRRHSSSSVIPSSIRQHALVDRKQKSIDMNVRRIDHLLPLDPLGFEIF